MRRRLFPYIRVRYVFEMLEYRICWCYLKFLLTDFIVSHLKVGEKHENTQKSSEYLKKLTQQAVILQKALNHIYSNTHSACIPPPKVCILNSEQTQICLLVSCFILSRFLCSFHHPAFLQSSSSSTWHVESF